MKISIVTAVYNREETLAQAIDSVQSQSYSSIEHIIQDGGSTDGTIDVINNRLNEKTFFESCPDAGIYDAINKGITRATGDVIGLLHSDDYLASEHLIAKIAEIMKNTKIDGVYGDLQYVSAKEPSHVVRHWKAGYYKASSLKYGWMPPHPTVYLRRSVFERFGMYDTRYKIAADYDAMLRYLSIGGIRLAYLPEVLVKMRTGGVSNKSIGHIMRKSKEDYDAIKINKIGGLMTLFSKNVRKISQFLN